VLVSTRARPPPILRVAVTRDPPQAIPVSGTWTGAPSDFLGMTVNVEAIPEG